MALNRISVALQRCPRSLSTRSYSIAPAKPAWVPRQYVKSSVASIQKAKASTGMGNEAPIAPEELKVSSSEVPPPNGNGVESINGLDSATDWSKSYHGLATQAFPKEVADTLMAPIDPLDVEMKPESQSNKTKVHADGLIYLPEIKYRRVLNKAFGPGAWGLAPRSETNVGPKIVSREYALICQGRLVAIARGEQEYFDPSGIPTATEACKSNALMRCCKDLGVASELWDPRFIREFKVKYCVEIFAEHLPTKKK
ncbi:hypothetical protein DXG03_000068 [Asterophora parasitica]|uniref:Mitochondrial genome maintenance protein MGM101 n=1 Tax=Asterophora parasitica TaxID=117018 RepID=A0A9P7KIG6_9AGAR|nr:hypothetical protein DXG03_000068 [Asterophora parasitica]